MRDPDSRLSAEEEVLVRGLADYVSAAEVIDLGRETRDEPAGDSLRSAVGVVSRLIDNNLVVAGDLWDDFMPWDCSADEAIGRIAHEWTAKADPFVLPGEIFWLELTSAGEEIARAALARG